MNKYKITAMTSFCVVLILIMSLVLPLKANANDKEKLELKLAYADSKVNAEIRLNYDGYNTMLCKFMLLDNVLEYDNLAEKVKKEGTNINVNQVSEGVFNTEIKDVNKRYVVIYVSAGNCNICDYIDCKEENSNESEAVTKEVETEKTKNKEQDAKEKTESNNYQEKENVQQNSNENIQKEDITQENSNEKIIVNNNESNEKNLVFEDIKTVEESSEKPQKEETVVNSVANVEMPKTGENDGIKIAGICFFSVIGVYSFVRYRLTK